MSADALFQNCRKLGPDARQNRRAGEECKQLWWAFRVHAGLIQIGVLFNSDRLPEVQGCFKSPKGYKAIALWREVTILPP